MNTKNYFVFLLFLLCFKSVTSLATESPVVYHLLQGDTVKVSVWREDTLEQEVKVLPDGSITLPLAGRIDVGGLSTPEVETLITEKLKKFLPDPVVTVVISSTEGNRAFVIGKVARPGQFIISGPTTVLQAISIMGGFDRFADEGGIKVIRKKGDAQEIISVHYKDIISGKDMSTNIQVQAGDTVIVP